MTWPAVYNGFPLLYPDSMSYLQDGSVVPRALFFRDMPDYPGRSFIYSLGILPLHMNVTLWPIIGFQGILTSYIIWLAVRSILPHPSLIAFFSLIVPISLLTSLSWFVSFIMPDVLGPVLYLAIYLIIFSWDDFSRTERLAVSLIAWWAVASHSTHLILATGLLIPLLLLLILQNQPMRRWLRDIGRVAVIIVFAAIAHLALHTCLYGKPSLTGKRPPVLLARIIADGPGRWYLQQNCHGLNLEICSHVQHLPNNVSDFLWAPDGIWRSSSAAKQDRLREEEMRVVLSTILTYPWLELRISAIHFWRQLKAFGLWSYSPNPWILEMFETVFSNARSRYLQSRQARQTLHEGFFTSVQNWTVMASLMAIGVWALLLGRGWSRRLVGLTTVIVFVVTGNAFVTGVLSNVDDRYQGRVVWLVPLLAGLLVLSWVDRRSRSSTNTSMAS
jgi:hypothetical protein